MYTNDNVAYFNNVHKTSYNKEQIDGIYWLCDIHKIKTTDGIAYAHNCHHCGKQIEPIGNEFCGPDCKLLNNLQDIDTNYQCFWGKECKICSQAYKTNGSNYNDYELPGDEILDDEILDDEILEENDEFEGMCDDLEYSDENSEEEPLLSLKRPEIIDNYSNYNNYSKPILERSVNYISSDEDDLLIKPASNKDNHIKSLLQDNSSNVFQENIIEMLVRLYGQSENKNKQ